jgi:hypothetical protein
MAVPVSATPLAASRRSAFVVWQVSNAGQADREAVGVVDLRSAVTSTLAILPGNWLVQAIASTVPRSTEDEYVALATRPSNRYWAGEWGVFRIEGGRVRRLPVRFRAELLWGAFAPSGEALAVIRESEDGATDELQVATLWPHVSQPRTVATFRERRKLLWARRGDRLLAWDNAPFDGASAVVLDLATGQKRTVGRRFHGIVQAAWDPSGDSVLIFAEGALWRVDLASGTSRRLLELSAALWDKR